MRSHSISDTKPIRPRAPWKLAHWKLALCKRPLGKLLLCKLPLVLLSLLAFVLPSLKARGASTVPEYDVKAAFLFNFIQFVEWPPRAFAGPNAPLVIGIIGNDPFGAGLDRIIKGEVIHGHKLVIKRIKHPDDAKGCQVLFLCKSEVSRIEQDLALVRGAGVLTVGDCERFVANGGVIGFTMVENNVRFQINPANAQHEGLIISSKLLRLAVAGP